MRIRVATFRHIYWDGQQYGASEELDVPDAVARTYFQLGHAFPADGVSVPAAVPEPEPISDEYRKPLTRPVEPRKAPRKRTAGAVCAQPDCPAFVPEGGKCAAHKGVSSTTGKRYHSSQRRVPKGRRTAFASKSRAYLRDHPVCEGERCSEVNPLTRNAATEVHHLDSLGLAGPRWDDESNWLACCKACHAVFTGRDYGFNR